MVKRDGKRSLSSLPLLVAQVFSNNVKNPGPGGVSSNRSFAHVHEHDVENHWKDLFDAPCCQPREGNKPEKPEELSYLICDHDKMIVFE